MPLVKTSDIIKRAQAHNTSVFSVICIDFNTIYGCIRAAEETKTPVLVQFLPEHANDNRAMNIEGFAGIAKKLAAEVEVPREHQRHCVPSLFSKFNFISMRSEQAGLKPVFSHCAPLEAMYSTVW